MDIIIITDDEHQTSSNDQSSSDDISSVENENLLVVDQNSQRQTSSNDQSSSDDISSVENENVLPVIGNNQRQTSSNDQSSSDDISSVENENLLPVNENNQRQTSSNNQSSPDDISSVAIENLLLVDENDQQRISGMSNIRVCPVKINDHSSLPNLQIKHPYQQDNNENDPFNNEKRIIIDKHVQVSHINRSELVRLNTEISLLKLAASSRRKSTSNVKVFRTNKNLSQSINNNQQIAAMTSRQGTVRINRFSTAVNIHQGSDQKIIASKPLVTRILVSRERSSRTKPKQLQAPVIHISVHSKKSF